MCVRLPWPHLYGTRSLGHQVKRIFSKVKKWKSPRIHHRCFSRFTNAPSARGGTTVTCFLFRSPRAPSKELEVLFFARSFFFLQDLSFLVGRGLSFVLYHPILIFCAIFQPRPFLVEFLLVCDYLLSWGLLILLHVYTNLSFLNDIYILLSIFRFFN